MLALVQFGHGCRQINMPFEDFLFSGFLSGHARAAMCDPEDLVRDHLPAFDPDEEEEVGEAFREACEQATEGEASNVRLDRHDLRFVRNAILSPEPNIIPFAQPLEAV
jgi:hypothetical protein